MGKCESILRKVCLNSAFDMQEIGDMENMTMLKVLEESKKIGVNPCYFPIRGSETVPEVQERAQEFLDVRVSNYESIP